MSSREKIQSNLRPRSSLLERETEWPAIGRLLRPAASPQKAPRREIVGRQMSVLTRR